MSTLAVRSAEPESTLAYAAPARILRDLWGHRDLIRQFAARELAMRHRGSTLGRWWSVLNPLLALVAYGFLFGVVMPARWHALGSTGEATLATIVLNIFLGITVYNLFAEVVIAAPSLVVARPQLVKRVVFPIQILPVTSVIASSVYALAAIVLVILGAGAAGHVSPTLWTLPIVLVALWMLILPIAWVLAALGVFLRDMPQIVGVIVGKFLIFTTPIFYPREAVPERFQILIDVNPMAWIVGSARDAVLRGEMPNLTALGIIIATGAIASCGAYALFMKARRGFADVL
ncbi:MAG: ABC transporter permease [Phycisphaerales bacterium]|jgi:lipopolysaccharide transport system permease protein|nr:ABC transporter permease [Phycisphaerales bacterium]